ncbi:MAG: hypothetical protein ABSF91_02700 [Bacteroidota bacterium]
MTIPKNETMHRYYDFKILALQILISKHIGLKYVLSTKDLESSCTSPSIQQPRFERA